MTDQNYKDLTKERGIEELAAGAGMGLAGKLIGRVFNLLTQVLLARGLGTFAFGLYSIGWSLFRALGPLATLGAEHGVIRFGAVAEDGREVDLEPEPVSRGLWLGGFGALGFGAVLFIGATWLAGAFGKPGLAPVLRAFAVALPLWGLAQIALAGTRISRDMRPTVIGEELAMPLVNLSAVILFFVLGFGLQGALWALLLGLVTLLSLGLYYLRKASVDSLSKPTWPSGAAQNFLAFSIPIGLAGLLSAWMGWVDRLAVGYFLPAEQAGVYHAAVQLPLVFSLILLSFNRIFAPLVVRYLGQDNHAQLVEIYRTATKWGFYLSLPVLVFFLTMPQSILEMLYGLPFRAGAAALVIVSIGQVVHVATGGVALLLILSDHQSLWLRTSGAASLLALVLNIMLVPRLGISGAALAAGLSLAFLFISTLFMVKRQLDLWPYDWSYLKGIGAALLSGLTVYRLLERIDLALILEVLVGGAISLLLFILLLWLFGLSAEDQRFISILRRRWLSL